MPDLTARPLRAASLLAANCAAAHRAAAACVAVALERDLHWREGASMGEVAGGELDLAFVCSLPATLMLQAARPAVALLGAPLLHDDRGGGRAVYFADLVVRRESPAQDLDALRGSVLACNEPVSLSGYRMLQWHLLERGEDLGFFTRVQVCGSHAVAMQAVLDAEADCAAIDSQVLAAAVRRDADLARGLRRVETLGPHPVPPVLAGPALPAAQRERARRALLAAHREPDVAAALASGAIDRFVAVSWRDYAPLQPLIEGLGIAPWF